VKQRPLSEFPSNSIAGSPERIAVYAARWAAGEQIFHPDDCSFIKPETHREGCRQPLKTLGIKFVEMGQQSRVRFEG
jgi:hypothetical protein